MHNALKVTALLSTFVLTLALCSIAANSRSCQVQARFLQCSGKDRPSKV